MTTAPSEPSEVFGLINATRTQRRIDFDAFIDSQPLSIPCSIHPKVARMLNRESSEAVSIQSPKPVAKYEECKECANERQSEEQRERLRKQGVPSNLLHATIENWNAPGNDSRLIVDKAREFAAKRRGFLVLLGADKGTGKTHLAVAVMRQFKNGRFIKQSTLLHELRRSYSDKAAQDPIETVSALAFWCSMKLASRRAVGMSSPCCTIFLTTGYGEKLPTVLTSNLDFDGLKEVIGERIADRLKEAAFSIFHLTGPSHRASRKDDYFRD
jgi:DNA replication protein DnaC